MGRYKRGTRLERVKDRPDVITSIITATKLESSRHRPEGIVNSSAIWRFKLQREGKWADTLARAKAMYLEHKGDGTRLAVYHNALTEALRETGYDTKAARDWFKKFIESCTAIEREKWTEYMTETMKIHDSVTPIPEKVLPEDDWRRDDLPDEIAWVASRPCMLNARQAIKAEKPLEPADFAGCPNLQARGLLDWAFENRDKFMEKLISLQLNQWGKRKPEVSEETKAQVAAVVEEKKEEVAKVVDRSEAERMLEQALKRFS